MRDEAWSSFEAVFDDAYLEVRRYIVRRAENPDVVEDLLAETFATAWRRREVLPDAPLPWLLGIARLVIANHRRGERRRTRLFARLARDPLDLGRDPADVLAERSRIARAFACLSDGEREVLRLVAWEGLDASEASAVLGCTPGTFRVRLHRARNELVKQLALAGHESSEATTELPQGETFQES